VRFFRLLVTVIYSCGLVAVVVVVENVPRLVRRLRRRGLVSAVGVVCGTALTWGCMDFGLRMLARSRLARSTGYTVVDERGPAANDDRVPVCYARPMDRVDPWATGIAHWCFENDRRLVGAGRDEKFDTADDITIEW
jgi:hypothetical protein